jgi:hypothetical protein
MRELVVQRSKLFVLLCWLQWVICVFSTLKANHLIFNLTWGFKAFIWPKGAEECLEG